MISFIRGKVHTLSTTHVWIDVANVGYELYVSQRTRDVLQQATGEVTLYTHLQVREDARILYGFSTIEEQRSFKLLIQISGISGHTARAILSALSSRELVQVVYAKDIDRLKQIKGIGAKMAERILLELKGKIKQFAIQVHADIDSMSPSSGQYDGVDVVKALQALGISKPQAEAVLVRIRPDITQSDTVEDIITKALQNV